MFSKNKKSESQKRVLVAPSILSADFSKLSEEIHSVEKAGADMLHLDIMDGHFVPNLTIGPSVVDAINRITDLPLDCHLMIENPERYIERFRESGADSITVHVEIAPFGSPVYRSIKRLGANVGVSLNPETSVESIFSLLPEVDLVLFMSVHPGFGGQKFLTSVLTKMKKLKETCEKEKKEILFEIDGGINRKTAKIAREAGADIIVAGSAIFQAKDRETEIAFLRGREKMKKDEKYFAFEDISLTVKCKSCGAENKNTNWYCDRCGHELLRTY